MPFHETKIAQESEHLIPGNKSGDGLDGGIGSPPHLEIGLGTNEGMGMGQVLGEEGNAPVATPGSVPLRRLFDDRPQESLSLGIGIGAIRPGFLGAAADEHGNIIGALFQPSPGGGIEKGVDFVAIHGSFDHLEGDEDVGSRGIFPHPDNGLTLDKDVGQRGRGIGNADRAGRDFYSTKREDNHRTRDQAQLFHDHGVLRSIGESGNPGGSMGSGGYLRKVGSG